MWQDISELGNMMVTLMPPRRLVVRLSQAAMSGKKLPNQYTRLPPQASAGSPFSTSLASEYVSLPEISAFWKGLLN